MRGVSVPVISVGNLTLGGTGKTPMVKWLAQWLHTHRIRPAIVSRGYGARSTERGAGSMEQENLEGGSRVLLPAPRSLLPALNDEAMELHRSLPEVPHVQNPDRVAGAERAINEFGCQVVLLDDGFQHRRLARDLDIVLLDASAPFGFEHVFPRGMLREPIEGLERASVVCLTRADLLNETDRAMIRQRVAGLAPRAALPGPLVYGAALLPVAAANVIGADTILVSLEDVPERIDDFEELLKLYDIVNLQRTGRIALPKLHKGQAPRLAQVAASS